MSFCDFIAGWTGGVLGLVAGHPFDTVKVNQQTKGIGVAECIRGIHKNYGPRGFFHGLGFPLVANGTLNSIFFGVYGHTVEALVKLQNEHYSDQSKHRSATNLPRTSASVGMKKAKVESVQANYWHCLIGGMVGGLVQLSLSCPVEVVKVKLQTAKISAPHHRYGTRRRGPIHVVGNILRTQGPRGLYQGLGVMAVRDIPSFGGYMLFYTAMSDGLQNWHLFTDKDGFPNSSRAVIAGGLAGTLSWWTIIPIDVIKSRMQADDPMDPKYSSVKDCALKIFKSQGYGGFFKGFWILSLRAFPVNGATFLAFEWIDWTCRSLSGNV